MFKPGIGMASPSISLSMPRHNFQESRFTCAIQNPKHQFLHQGRKTKKCLSEFVFWWNDFSNSVHRINELSHTISFKNARNLYAGVM